MKAPTFKTSRLLLEPFSAKHSNGMFKLWSSPEVCQYSGDAHDFGGGKINLPAESPRDSDKILNFFIQYQARSEKIRWAVSSLEDQCFIGAVGFNTLSDCAELAYHLHPSHWGKGYAMEACQEIVTWRLHHNESTSLEAFIEPDNFPSINIVTKLGFNFYGESSEGCNRYLYVKQSALGELKN